MSSILITCANSPDIDGLACAIALSKFKNHINPKNNYEYGFGTLGHIEGQFVAKELGFNYTTISSESTFDFFILVDACEKLGLPEIVDFLKVIEVIDHRLFPDYEAFPNARFQIEPVGAAATQIAELFHFQKIPLDPKTATLLLCAIYSNTNNFLADSTNFRDHRMKDWLISYCEADNQMPQRMFEYKTQYTLKNLKKVLVSDRKAGSDLDFYQLEVLDSTSFRDKIISEKILQELSGTKDYICAIQDIGTESTFITAGDNGKLFTLEKAGIRFTSKNNWWQTDQITMRKTLIKCLKS